jgi:serine protease Do
MPRNFPAAPGRYLRNWLTLLVIGLACNLPAARADQAGSKGDLPAVFDKVAPESVEDLRAIQNQVRHVLEKVVPCTVGVQVGGSSGSGVIVNAEGIVLTAGHVSGKPGQDCTLIFHDGKRAKGKTLGQNKGIDSGMIKIVDEDKEGTWPFIEMGNSADLKKGQWVIATGHPGGFKTGRSPVVRLGRVLDVTKSLIRSDCTLVGGDSGGPLFDMNGKIVGIHSRIGGTIRDNVHVPVDTYRETWDRLVKSESWGGFSFSRGDEPYLGIQVDLDNKKECKVRDVNDNSPASKAGLKAGDVILKIDTSPLQDADDLDIVLKRKKPGDEVEVEVKRGEERLKLMLTLGKK